MKLYNAVGFALGVFFCQYWCMASSLRTKLKVYPSGRVSLVSSLTCQSCQTSASEAGEVNPGTMGKPVTEGNTKECDSLPPGKGSLGSKSTMSWKSARNLCERLAAMECEYGRGNLWFLTLTQPSSDPRAFEALARYSSYAVDRLNREFKRFFVGDFARANVWEYQKRGSLHVHFCIGSHCMDASDLEEFREYIGKVWYRILGDISSKFESHPYRGKNGRDRTFRDLMNIDRGEHFVNCQVVQKSVVAYLSKYLSDSNHKKDYKQKQQLRRKFFPIATWAQWNRKATECYRNHYDEFDFGEAEIDKREAINRIIYRWACDVELAEGTEIKEPQNIYNSGVYLIPLDICTKSFQTNILDVIRRLSLFHRVNKPASKLLAKQQETASFYQNGDICWDGELTVRQHFRDAEIEKRKRAKNGGMALANLGFLLLDLIEKTCYNLSVNRFNNYQQLELDL